MSLSVNQKRTEDELIEYYLYDKALKGAKSIDEYKKILEQRYIQRELNGYINVINRINDASFPFGKDKEANKKLINELCLDTKTMSKFQLISDYTVNEFERRVDFEFWKDWAMQEDESIKSISHDKYELVFDYGNKKSSVRNLDQEIDATPRLRYYLRSFGRLGDCHNNAINLLNNFDNSKADVVTGLASELSPVHKFLHSWVECLQNGEYLVFDYSTNSVSKKEDYYNLMHIDSERRINGETVKSECSIIEELQDREIPHAIKLYLDNRTEALNLHQKLTEGEMQL